MLRGRFKKDKRLNSCDLGYAIHLDGESKSLVFNGKLIQKGEYIEIGKEFAYVIRKGKAYVYRYSKLVEETDEFVIMNSYIATKGHEYKLFNVEAVEYLAITDVLFNECMKLAPMKV